MSSEILAWNRDISPRCKLWNDESSHTLRKVQLYLRSIENGDFGYIASLFSPDAVLEQLPNRIYPKGVRGGVSRMVEAFEKGRKLLSSQTYEIKSFVSEGDRSAIEILWTGTLALSFGNLAVGSQMRAHSAMFFSSRTAKLSVSATMIASNRGKQAGAHISQK